MRQIKEYITERLKISSDLTRNNYKYFPKTKDELVQILEELLKERGPNADLNDIDTSKIKDMHSLFSYIDVKIRNIDISQWNVSNVESMSDMFFGCEEFNCDLSQWDVSSCKNMYGMFYFCKKFDSDLSQWDVSNVEDLGAMFAYCENFNSNISRWNVSRCENMANMFIKCKKFSQDLNRWKVDKVNSFKDMFIYSKMKKDNDLPFWYNNI